MQDSRPSQSRKATALRKKGGKSGTSQRVVIGQYMLWRRSLRSTKKGVKRTRDFERKTVSLPCGIAALRKKGGKSGTSQRVVMGQCMLWRRSLRSTKKGVKRTRAFERKTGKMSELCVGLRVGASSCLSRKKTSGVARFVSCLFFLDTFSLGMQRKSII